MPKKITEIIDASEAPVFDFRNDLITAIEDAPLADLSDTGLSDKQSLELANELSRLADEPSDSLVLLRENHLPGDIVIEDAHAFPILIKQTMKMLWPFAGNDTISSWCKETVEHEMAHAAAAMMLGKEVRYGIRIVKKLSGSQEYIYLMNSFIKIKDQPITKAELAFITAAPESPGEADEHVLKSLGYTSLIPEIL